MSSYNIPSSGSDDGCSASEHSTQITLVEYTQELCGFSEHTQQLNTLSGHEHSRFSTNVSLRGMPTHSRDRSDSSKGSGRTHMTD